ncbi:domain of Kin17 curved DNA-binding protein-domain-containing protein [Apodospora peruviana]|uniref:Domain of Kin17 curved DNA-binding protein-domain-containing protein n=1 Tax=Apodospora peruviana TaxID=516989 RepID=A0AAE0IHI6_9PEZI|nr:domain of Kin17 curved DNA-binding protein-domain-containing protein [Apodospora peruviana]
MPKAEAGSTKHLSNQMKSRGLNRLRWYCQICEKSCRDENGYKMHCQSPSHTRKALEAGQNFKGLQEDFSKEFKDQFLSLLRTSHGEKEIHANKFYQEVIAQRDHTHLNATKWHSLTEFVKYLGRESLCRVKEKEDGLFIAWIDDSPEAMKRREAVRRKELQDRGDEECEQMLLREQIKRAQKDAVARGVAPKENEEEAAAVHELKRQEGEKITLSLGPKPATLPTATVTAPPQAPGGDESKGGEAKKGEVVDETSATEQPAPAAAAAVAKPVSLKFGVKPQVKNVFKNAFAGAPKKTMAAQPKQMSEAERIMKEEIERKRAREQRGGPPHKRPRF